MRRRTFLTVVLGSAATWPHGARAQRATMPVIGLLSATKLDEREVDAVRQGLSEAGYDEGRNV